jgi:hypothetical protein
MILAWRDDDLTGDATILAGIEGHACPVRKRRLLSRADSSLGSCAIKIRPRGGSSGAWERHQFHAMRAIFGQCHRQTTASAQPPNLDCATIRDPPGR